MESVVDVICQELVEKFGVFGTDIRPDMTFESLEIDSLVLIELSVVLERKFGVKVPDGELTADQTIGEVAALVHGKRVEV